MTPSHHRRFSASDPAGDVLRALEERPCRDVVIVCSRGWGAPFEIARRVDPALIAALRACPPCTPLAEALRLPGGDGADWMKPGLDGPEVSFLSEPGAGAGPDEAPFFTPNRDDERPPAMGGATHGDGPPRARSTEAPPPPRAPRSAMAAVYPELACSHSEVTPGDQIEVSLSLSERARAALAPRIDVVFPEGAVAVDLLATVSDARGFERPDGETWSVVLTVRPGPAISPRSWTFRARAADAERHEITVTFFAGAAVVGHVTLTLPRSDRRGALAAAVSMEPVALRPPRRGMSMLVTPAAAGYEIQLVDDGVPQEAPVRWASVNPAMLAQICNKLESAGDAATVRAQGKALWTQLPPAVRAWLCRSSARGVPLTVTSDEPLLPIEATVLVDAPGSGDKPVLGVDRAVVRWIPEEAEPPALAIDVATAACIRPDYADAMGGAIDEERQLQARVQRPIHVGTASELTDLLARADVPLIHFAGHAQGAPTAGLVMDAGNVTTPLDFLGTTLLGDGHPFVFLNGCRAGFAQPGLFTVYANFPKTLVVAHASGIVASVIQVKVDAAPIAAAIFYDAVASGAPVGEAVRRMREQAFATPVPSHAASFMSYLAYAPPDLVLRLRPAA